MKLILDFPNNTISSCFFFFLIIDLHFSAVIAQSFKSISELVVPIGMPSKEAKAEIEIQLTTTEAKIRKYLM